MQLDLDFADIAERQPKKKSKTGGNDQRRSSTTQVVTTAIRGQGNAGDRKKATPLEKRFDKLWRQLEQRQKKIDSFESDYEKAREWIQNELTEQRQLYKNELLTQTEKLISHMAKKSLANWQREELGSWIEDNLGLLDIHGATELGELAKKYYDARMAALSVADRTFIEEVLNDDSIDELMAELEAESFDDDEFLDDDSWEDDEFDIDSDQPDDTTYDQSNKSESAYEQMRAHEKKQKKLIFDKSIVSKLFRRTAKALHPDHEQDPKRRDEKQTLMKTLLEARKSGNIAMIFKLYRDHVDNATIEIDLPELQPMIDLLVQQIAELDQAFFEQSHQSPMHDWVSSNISGKSEKRKQAALGLLKKDLEQDIRNTRKLYPHLASLAKLKPLLEQRYEQHMFSYY